MLVNFVAVVALLSVPLMASTFDSPPSDLAIELLQQMEQEAADLTRQAAELESLFRTKASMQSHVNQLNMIVEKVEALNKLVRRFEETKDDQLAQEAIKQVEPSLKVLVAYTNAALKYLNENPGKLFNRVYKGYVRGIFIRAERIREAVDAFVEYGKGLRKIAELRNPTS